VSDNPLVPVGPTLFPKSALDAAVREMIPQLPPGRSHGIGFAHDCTGTRFAVLFGDKDGRGIDWEASGAVLVDPKGHVGGAVAGNITW